MVHDVVRELGHLTLGTRLKRLGERLQAQTQRILDVHGVPIQASQFPFLAAIDRVQPITVGELAEAVGVTQPAATRALAQLQAEGLVAIAVASGDQRRKQVTLTRRGAAIVDTGRREVWPVIEAAVKSACHRLSGPLLAQLAQLEDRLADEPIDRRARTGARRRA